MGLLWAGLGLAVLAALLLLAALIATRRRVRRISQALNTIAQSVRPRIVRNQSHHAQQVALVVNPSKELADHVVATVRRICREAALPEPLVFETSIEDPGTGQAQAAIAAGADVVCAAGGDGTVRAVAKAMLETGVPMAILPTGTGNLLARNLKLPLTSIEEAMAVALGGQEQHIDVGWATVIEAASHHPLDGKIRAATTGDRQLFLVIAGLGFDAIMVAEANDTLKRRMGWLAYFLVALRHLHDQRTPCTITIDNRAPQTTKMRTAMVGNCGLLPGNLTLLPQASIDDGVLDVAVIDTRIGMVGWTQLFGEVLWQGAGKRPKYAPRIGTIDCATATRVTIRTEAGQLAQVDGDPMGQVVELECRVDPGALLVRAV